MKKIIAIALALMLCVGLLSVSAFAAFDNVESLAVVGDGIPGVPSWKPEAPEGDMTEVSEGIWEKTLDVTAGTTMKLKIAGNDKWDDTCNFGSANLVLGEKADLTCSGGSSDMPFTADKDMTLKITVDLTGDVATILLEEVGAAGGETPEEKPEEKPEIDPDAIYRVAGGEALCGSNWDVTDDNNKMTVDANGIYSITYSGVAAGEYEFKIALNGTWDKNWGANGENGDNVKITVAEGDDVTISFNPATGKISVTGATSNIPATGDMNMTAIFVVLAVACCGVVALVCTKKKFF
jgi:hypothetical protein